MTYFRNGAFLRGSRLAARGGSPALCADGRLTFPMHLQPGQTWRADLCYELMDGETVYLALAGGCVLNGGSPQGRALHAWQSNVAEISSSMSDFQRLIA